MTNARHTSGKWSVGHAGFDRIPSIIAARAGRPVTVAHCSGNHEEDEANARLIVRAVNAHDDLVAALKAARRYVETCTDPSDDAVLKQVDAAITKAGATP